MSAAAERLHPPIRDLVIPNPTPELLTQAVQTLPVLPEYTKLLLSRAGEFNYFYRKNEHTEEDYIKRCLDASLIPFSQINLRYNNSVHEFTPSNNGIKIAYEVSSSESPDAVKRRAGVIAQAIANGYGMADVQLEVEHDRQGEGFDHLREGLLADLLSQGHSIINAEIWLGSIDRRGHYNEGASPMGELHYSGRSLEVWPQRFAISRPDDWNVVQDWFTGLQQTASSSETV
jgi:hypothetical protein